MIRNVASNPVTLLTMTEVPGVGTVTNFNGYVGTVQFPSDHPGNGWGEANNPKWMDSVCPA